MGRSMLNLNSIPTSRTATASLAVDGIEQHREYLFHTAIGRLRDREAAEDVVQDSFVAAFAGANRFSGNATQRTWITGILKHKICDHVRRSCRDRALFENAEANDRGEFDSYHLEGYPRSRDFDPGIALERKELRDAIENAIAKLPERLARAFSLYECEDYSGREVCEELDISENNLWIMLHRARKELRRELSSWTGAVA